MKEDLELKEYREALNEYEQALKEYKQYKEVRAHSYMSVYGGCFIRVYKVENDNLGKRVVNVTDDDSIVCYRCAARDLRDLIAKEEKRNENKKNQPKSESDQRGSSRISNMYAPFYVPEHIEY